MLLTAEGGNVLGKCTDPNGDCAIEPAADEGVTEPECVPDKFGVENIGIGICTRNSGDL
jgi:hypothetical protein